MACLNTDLRNETKIMKKEPKPNLKLPFPPRTMWADYDPKAKPTERLQVYSSRRRQRATHPDLKPIRVAVIPHTNEDALVEHALEGWMEGAKAIEGGVRGVLRSLGLLGKDRFKGPF